MLNESRLYSFIDHKNGFTLHFLEGQKLISDLVTIHNLNSNAFLFYRNLILTNQLLVAFLKEQEQFYIYIDSTQPKFNFKLEMNYEGEMRSLIFSDKLGAIPERLNGQCRLVKFIESTHKSYTSTLQLNNHLSSEIANKIIADSYQLNSLSILSDVSDQSVLISKLPDQNVNKFNSTESLNLHEFSSFHQKTIHTLFQDSEARYEIIQKTLESAGLTFLGSKEIKFNCSCNVLRFKNGVDSIVRSNGIDSIFDHDQDEIEIKCDYCNKKYFFNRNQFN